MNSNPFYAIRRRANLLRVLSAALLTVVSAICAQSTHSIAREAYVRSQQRDADDGLTALMRAARDGERNNVKALLEQGVDVNVRDTGSFTGGWSALTYAAANGDLEIVKALVSNGAEVDSVDESGATPLMAAAQYDNASVVKALIEKGADVNRRDKSGASALTKALRFHREKIAGILRKAGAVEPPVETTPRPATPNQVLANESVDSKPLLLNNPQPSYTTRARDAGIQGVVRGRALIGADGTVKRFRILTGLPFGLSYQAMDAAYQMTFQPARKKGQPVAYMMAIEIQFKLK